MTFVAIGALRVNLVLLVFFLRGRCHDMVLVHGPDCTLSLNFKTSITHGNIRENNHQVNTSIYLDMIDQFINYFPSSGDLCCLLLTFANSLDPDQA